MRISAFISILMALVFLGSLFGGCSEQDGEGFAIYLTRDDIPPDRMEMMSHVEIADEPVISIDDIVSYDALTHRIELTDKALNRIYELEVPVNGRSFLVCIDASPVYWGAFWVMYSSLSFDGVTIMKPLPGGTGEMTIGMGYPSPGFFDGKDPRNNLEVMESLKQAGKLVNEKSFTLIEQLPHSMKGYELYSWRAGSEWHFKLITGTNRTKTLEEIADITDDVSELVDIHVEGVDALLTLLSKLPDSEPVFWNDGLTVGDTTGDIILEMPDEVTVSGIEYYAGELGIELTVAPGTAK